MQLDQGERGFSFMREGPLDMRMDPRNPLTASEIVNKWHEAKLGELFRDYGEERHWRRAAKAIVEARRKKPIRTTKDLADVIAGALRPKGKKRLHPATLIFQALRIYVNQELEVLEKGIVKAIDRLRPGGKIGVISFHSLEDRIVKNTFKSSPLLHRLTKKPLVPSFEEQRKNPRARSAKMRFAERV